MKVRDYLLLEERADYSTEHLQDVLRNLRNGMEDIYELFDDLEDKKGMIQTNKMKKEWKVLEKMVKPFVFNMDRINQFRDELNGVVSESKEDRIRDAIRLVGKYHIQDALKEMRRTIYDINEFLAEIGDTKQFKKFFKEFTKLENILKGYLPDYKY